MTSIVYVEKKLIEGMDVCKCVAKAFLIFMNIEYNLVIGLLQIPMLFHKPYWIKYYEVYP